MTKKKGRGAGNGRGRGGERRWERGKPQLKKYRKVMFYEEKENSKETVTTETPIVKDTENKVGDVNT